MEYLTKKDLGTPFFTKCSIEYKILSVSYEERAYLNLKGRLKMKLKRLMIKLKAGILVLLRK
jgi:hypothetical protein